MFLSIIWSLVHVFMIIYLFIATRCGLEARVNNDLMQIRADAPESPKSMSETSDSSSRQLLSSTDSDDSIQSPKRVVRPRIEVSFVVVVVVVDVFVASINSIFEIRNIKTVWVLQANLILFI